MIYKPKFIEGNIFTDKRGSLSCVNGFNMDKVKRFYLIEHPNTSILRAWQGHRKEQKWFYVTAGGFKVVLLKPDNWVKPTGPNFLAEFTLDADKPGVLQIPGGYLNGFKAVRPYSKMIVFSNFTVKQSVDDDFRFDANLLFTWNETS